MLAFGNITLLEFLKQWRKSDRRCYATKSGNVCYVWPQGKPLGNTSYIVDLVEIRDVAISNEAEITEVSEKE